MALPPASPRKLSHTRTVVYRGYDREDGLWDIEAELSDVKPYTLNPISEPAFPAHLAIHHLHIRVTLDDQMVIHDIVTDLERIPHAPCEGSTAHMHALKGQRMGPGWRRMLQQHLGGTAGCTHLREMLFNMATVAYQTLPSGQWHRRELAGQAHPQHTRAPHHLGQCHAWALDGPMVARIYPMFYQPKVQPPEKKA